jgi:transposase InsO family protein
MSSEWRARLTPVFLQQQDKFEDFIQEYNYERPHQALNMKRPGDLYRPSSRQGNPPLFSGDRK